MTARLLAAAVLLTLAARPSSAQLTSTFSDLFNQILGEELALSPGQHAGHFEPAAEIAVGTLTPAFNGLIAGNITSFPLSSTAAGVTFDFSSGQPVSVLESQGPIFAEIAQTLGKSHFNVGVTATRLNLSRLRGIPLDEIRFTFPHQDLGSPGLGDNPTEIDLIDVYMGLDVGASIFALSGTYGLTDALDVGVAIPFVSINVEGTARAVVDSRTITRFGQALHFFDGTAINPVLELEEEYEASASGIGDIALRAKYRFPTQSAYDLAALADVRLPTGDEEDFLGSGSLGFRLALLASTEVGNFTPHLNVGFDRRGTASDSTGDNEFDRNSVVIVAGFDQQIASGVTFAIDLLSNFSLSDDPLDDFPDRVFIQDGSEFPTGGSATREVRLTNIPIDGTDNTLDLSVGARVAFSDRFQVLGNLLVPLNDGGLRSSVVPTVGASLTL